MLGCLMLFLPGHCLHALFLLLLLGRFVKHRYCSKKVTIPAATTATLLCHCSLCRNGDVGAAIRCCKSSSMLLWDWRAKTLAPHVYILFSSRIRGGSGPETAFKLRA
ncbi:hypothetical protein THASP1DRAFT_25960 [Thamnocephalis sphaerospora]|uniref:Uncharacterized protein n=1 Tax=Thamnocephalis sphaerospora TaxID=78915 RepID=A0A4P9XK18_9FUNG|nr:hypothetical protein THASP1DRAFT_25960 [Thamnocephalis sphaerospora]|eukprot:RKP05560.1 hypothetical protein THASP1DRAFT_25960 [Thamnocephalis sphaerospora]